MIVVERVCIENVQMAQLALSVKHPGERKQAAAAKHSKLEKGSLEGVWMRSSQIHRWPSLILQNLGPGRPTLGRIQSALAAALDREEGGNRFPRVEDQGNPRLL